MEKSNLLECRNICKSFGENHVLKGINIKLFSGEVSAIIGGNGAGKSTLMKIIMGIYKADKGEIFLNSNEYKSLTPSIALNNGVYLVPQEPMLFKNMTVLENILIGLQGKISDQKVKLQSLNCKMKCNKKT